MTKEHETDPREIDTADIEAAAVRSTAGSSRLRWLTILLALVTVASIAYAVTSFVGAREDAQKDERRAQATTQAVGDQATEQSDRIIAICKDDSDEATKLEEAGLCGKATQTKDLIEKQVPASAPRNGVDGADATMAQAFAAVQRFGPTGIAAYCAKNNDCKGDPGADGKSVTPTELAAAINKQAPQLLAAYCAANNGCRGLPGPKGDTGAKGDAVKGDPGKGGSDGTNGRGIASLDCTGSLTPLTLTLTYSDGTTAAIECGPGQPDPEPDVAP